MPSTKVAVVTGGSRGIGSGICVALARSGWTIVINFVQDEEAAQNTKNAVNDEGGTGSIFRADISQAQDRLDLLEFVQNEFGRVDLLVNNAGIAPKVRADMLDLSEESYDEVMTVNLKGPFFLTSRFAKLMVEYIEQGVLDSPKIINIGSISAVASSVNRAEYCLSKAALGMATNLWASRLAEYGISVFELRPGIIQTDMTSGVKEKYDRMIFREGLTPIKRWGTPDDVGKAVVAIAEDLLPYSTGEVIYIDGGFHLRRL